MDIVAKIRWSDLGCPKVPGPYWDNAVGRVVTVKQVNIDAAGGNPSAICRVHGFRLVPGGRPQYHVGAVERAP